MIGIESPGTRRKSGHMTAGQPGRAHTPCVGPHVFIWDESAVDRNPPEGQSCNCGMFELHYSICDCGCGRATMSMCFKRGRNEGSDGK